MVFGQALLMNMPMAVLDTLVGVTVLVLDMLMGVVSVGMDVLRTAVAVLMRMRFRMRVLAGHQMTSFPSL